MANRPHLKTSHTEIKETQYVNVETGEVQVEQEIKKHKYLTKSKEEFFLTYTYLLQAQQKDMTLAEIKVYSYLLQHYKAGSPIGITKHIREIIGEELDIKERTVAISLSSLCTKEKPLLYRKEKGVYYLNPLYAFRGSTTDRNVQLKAIIELGCKDC